MSFYFQELYVYEQLFDSLTGQDKEMKTVRLRTTTLVNGKEKELVEGTGLCWDKTEGNKVASKNEKKRDCRSN